MRSYVYPLLCVTLFACATQVDEFTPEALSTAGDSGGGALGGGGIASTSGGTGGNPFANGGAGHSGSSMGGGFSFSGTASFAGTFASGGMPGGGNSASGAGGSAGKANGGAAGKASGGMGGGGAGGAGTTQCSGVTVPAKNKWKATALRASAGDPPERAIDGDNATRFSTGAAQMGDEWLQIDFGTSVTLNEVTLTTGNDDYFRHYQVRLSTKSEDFAAAILKEGDGATGTITLSLPQTHKGQYLTIRQTGKASPAWWSLFEVSVACK
jgi:hypothetical protein